MLTDSSEFSPGLFPGNSVVEVCELWLPYGLCWVFRLCGVREGICRDIHLQVSPRRPEPRIKGQQAAERAKDLEIQQGPWESGYWAEAPELPPCVPSNTVTKILPHENRSHQLGDTFPNIYPTEDLHSEYVKNIYSSLTGN